MTKKNIITPKNFSYGSSSAQRDNLRHCPGKVFSSTSLAVEGLLGPENLTTLVRQGTDISTFLATSFRHWRKTTGGQPLYSEVKAVTLGSIIHLEMLAHDSSKQALEQRPSLEVALRRLYAILYVDETFNNDEHATKKDAWQEIERILESTQQGSVMSDSIADSVSKRMNLKRRRLATMKAIKENQPHKRVTRLQSHLSASPTTHAHPNDTRQRPQQPPPDR